MPYSQPTTSSILSEGEGSDTEGDNKQKTTNNEHKAYTNETHTYIHNNLFI